jgi:hypothetical protein
MPRKSIEEQIDELRDTRRHGDPKDKPKEKRSWRDLDRSRDRGGSGSKSKPSFLDRYNTPQAQQALKEELMELFRDKDGEAMKAKILAATDKNELEEAIQAYLDARGRLPPDPELLDKAMDTRKDKTLREVVEAVGRALPETDDARRRALLAKLRTKARRSFDAKVAKAARALLSEYGVED